MDQTLLVDNKNIFKLWLPQPNHACSYGYDKYNHSKHIHNKTKSHGNRRQPCFVPKAPMPYNKHIGRYHTLQQRRRNTMANTKLKISYGTEENPDGSKTFSNINPESSNEDLVSTAQKFVSLQEKAVRTIERIDTTTISG
jgi:hypothetical protein